MDNRLAEMVRAVRLQLEDVEGGVKPGDEILILSSTDNYPPLVDAYVTAVASTGAEPILLTYTARPPLVGLPDSIVDAAIQADMLIDLSYKSWAYTESHGRYIRESRARGGRPIRGQTYGWEEDVFHLIRLVPDPEIKERSQRAKELIDKAQTIRLTSSLGTDLVVQRGDPDQHLLVAASGFVAFAPPDDGADGVIYYQGGFRIQFPAVIKKMVYQPIRMEVQKGTVVDIARDSEAGIVLDDWLRSHHDANSYHFAEVGFGFDPRIELHRLDNLAVHAENHGIMFGIGTNFSAKFGTSVRARSHIDMMYTGVDYWFDDLRLVQGGEFTEESGLRGPFK